MLFRSAQLYVIPVKVDPSAVAAAKKQEEGGLPKGPFRKMMEGNDGDKLKDLLKSTGIRFEEISKQDAEDKGYWNPEWKTVPQMWLFKKHIGGYTDYLKYTESQTSDSYADCASCEA